MTAPPQLDVCLISSAYHPYPSGVSEHARNLAAALRGRGHRVTVLTTRYPGTTGDEPGVARLGRALILPANGSRFTLPVGWRLGARVRDFLHRQRFDVVHCHGIFPPELAYWAARHASCPVVVTFHTFGLELPDFIRAGFRSLFRGLVRRVDARIAVSRAGRSWAERWFPGDYDIIPNGVDLTRFRPGPAPPETELLFVGRIEKRKGLAVLLAAMPRLLSTRPGLRLTVVGTGPEEGRCRGLCDRLGIAASVRFAGRVAGDDLPGCYARSTLFLAPALGGEAMGIVLVEAMACGTPVAASRIAGYDEVVEDGTSGLLVPPGAPDAWAEAVGRVLDSPPLRRRLADGALDRARGFAWPAVAERVEKVYRRMLA